VLHFGNKRAEEAYNAGFVSGLAKHIGRKTHRMIHPLVAAHSWQDVGLIVKVATWPNYPYRYGLEVEGKWFLTFIWDAGVGAMEIKLERR